MAKLKPTPLDGSIKWIGDKLQLDRVYCPRCESYHPMLLHPMSTPMSIRLGGERRVFTMYGICARLHQPVMFGFGQHALRSDGEYQQVYWG